MLAFLKNLFASIVGTVKKAFGSQADREFKKGTPIIDEINRHCEALAPLSDAELFARTEQFRQRLRERTAALTGEVAELETSLRGDLEPGEREGLNDRHQAVEEEIHAIQASFLDEVQAEAFAVVRDACRRLVGRSWDVMGGAEEWFMQPYDVQLYGGTVLHSGKVAEMATGEGKTLVAVAPLYLNALTGMVVTSLRTTITWPSAMLCGWAAFTISSACPSG